MRFLGYLPQEVATAEGREATRSRASESPWEGECMGEAHVPNATTRT
jgi:hypothetical protein